MTYGVPAYPLATDTGRRGGGAEMSSFKWTDEKVKEFTKVATGGSYGDYQHCRSIDSKMKRFKILNIKREFDPLEYQNQVLTDLLLDIKSLITKSGI